MSSSLDLQLDPVLYVVRGYPGPAPDQPGPGYDLVLSVFMLGNGRARVFAAHGEISAATLRALADKLRALWVDTVLVNRHGVEQEWKTGRATAHLRERP